MEKVDFGGKNNFIALLSKEVEKDFRMVFAPTTRQKSKEGALWSDRSLVHLLRAFPVIFHIMTYASEARAAAVKWPRAREEEEEEKKKAVTMAGCRTGRHSLNHCCCPFANLSSFNL